MPTYGYRCGSCGHEFEILQRITDKPLTTCPECGATLTKKLYPVGISFKGSGFYTTDYKSSGASSDAASSNGASGASESASLPGSKTESKPETKSDSKSETKAKSKSESKSEKAS